MPRARIGGEIVGRKKKPLGALSPAAPSKDQPDWK